MVRRKGVHRKGEEYGEKTECQEREEYLEKGINMERLE